MDNTLEALYQIPVTLGNDNFSLYGDGLLVNDCLKRYGFDAAVVRHLEEPDIAVVITSVNINSVRKLYGIQSANIYRIEALDYINDHGLSLAAPPTAIQNNTPCNNA